MPDERECFEVHDEEQTQGPIPGCHVGCWLTEDARRFVRRKGDQISVTPCQDVGGQRNDSGNCSAYQSTQAVPLEHLDAAIRR